MVEPIKPAEETGNIRHHWLIAGLGNPGRDYEKTRHNIGFMVLTRLASQAGIQLKPEKRFKGLVGHGQLAGHRITLIEPQTYMNLSGEAIVPLMRFYQIESAQLIVVYDDAALPFGRLRIRREGSSGGQNGMKSIIQHLGGDQGFPRLRLGIAPAETDETQQDLASYVLSTFSATERKHLDAILDNAIEALEMLLNAGIDKAMEAYNGKDLLT